MRVRAGGALCLVGLLLGGCAGGPGAESAGMPWKVLARPEPAPQPPGWEWVIAVPQGATRAELVVPAVPADRLAALLPEAQDRGVRLASAGGADAVAVTAVNRRPVANYDQLNSAVMRAVEAGKKVDVALAGAGPSEGVPAGPARLLALSQAAAPGDGLLRVTEDGNPWVLLRRDGVRCKVMARVERGRALLHVAMSLGVCWGPRVTLPGEVRASCDGVPLRCLSVAGALDALYGEGPAGDAAGPEEGSFAAVSERPDYLLPTNYKRLQEAVPPAVRRRGPALAALPGLAYPGPAVLGDARALSSFLQQRQLYQPGEPERVGWVVFAGDALAHAQAFDLDVDLGEGPVRLSFTVTGP